MIGIVIASMICVEAGRVPFAKDFSNRINVQIDPARLIENRNCRIFLMATCACTIQLA